MRECNIVIVSSSSNASLRTKHLRIMIALSLSYQDLKIISDIIMLMFEDGMLVTILSSKTS